MARIRSIKPEFWQNEELAACSAHARLLAIAILQLADANGVFLYIPMQIHAHAFPWEAEVNTPVLLGELEGTGYVSFFVSQGKKYGVITNFRKHQRLTGKEAESSGSHPSPYEENQQVEPFSLRGSSQCFPGKHLDAQEQGTGNREREQGKRNREQGTGRVAAPAKSQSAPPKTSEVWASYQSAYHARYGVDPVRNAKVNGQLSSFVDRVGVDEAPHIAAHYVQSQNGFYVARGHGIDCMLADAEKLRTEWATGRRVTQTQARQADRTESRGAAFDNVIRELEEAKNGETGD